MNKLFAAICISLGISSLLLFVLRILKRIRISCLAAFSPILALASALFAAIEFLLISGFTLRLLNKRERNES